MNSKNYFMRVSNKLIISIIISYFFMVLSFLNKVYFIENLCITKLELETILFLLISTGYVIIKRVFKNQNIVKIYLISILFLIVVINITEIKNIYNNVSYKDFFHGYISRTKDIYNNGFLASKYLVSRAQTLIINGKISPMEHNTNLNNGRRRELFDLVNRGLSSQEKDHIWTENGIVQIPLYIEKEIHAGNIIIECYPFQEQKLYIYVNDKYIDEIYVNDNTTLKIPFQKDMYKDLIVVKFILPYANKSPREINSNSKDDRNLGISLKNIVIENKEHENIDL